MIAQKIHIAPNAKVFAVNKIAISAGTFTMVLSTATVIGRARSEKMTNNRNVRTDALVELLFNAFQSMGEAPRVLSGVIKNIS